MKISTRLNRRHGAVTTFVALAALTLTACGTATGAGGTGTPIGTGTPVGARPMEIRVDSDTWSGWVQEHRPNPITTAIPATIGSKGTHPLLNSSVTFTVTKVSDQGVEVEVSQAMSPATPGGGIDVHSTQTHFTVKPGAATRFSSPTLDAGRNYTLTLVDAGSTVVTPTPTDTHPSGPPPCGCDFPQPSPTPTVPPTA